MIQTVASPPSPPGKPFVGHLFDFRRDPPKLLSELARAHGDIVHFKLGPQDIYLLNHPDYIRDVLVTHNRNFVKSRGLEMAKKFLGESLLTSEGEFHRRQRRLAQPAFHRQRINAYAEVMIDHAVRTRERWRDGETVDMWQEMMRLTLAIVGKTLFDADVESEAPEIGKALTDVMQLFERVTNPFGALLDKLPLPANIRWLKAKARLDATIYRLINERRRSGEDRGDLLSMLLLAQQNVRDGAAHRRRQVLRRHRPVALALKRSPYRRRDPVRIDTGDHVAAALHRLWTLRDIARRHIGDVQDAAFLLHRATVGQHARCVTLEREKVEEA